MIKITDPGYEKNDQLFLMCLHVFFPENAFKRTKRTRNGHVLLTVENHDCEQLFMKFFCHVLCV